MAYADFTMSRISRQFSLTRDEDTSLFGAVPPAALDPAFIRRLQEDSNMALRVSTDKARSEFIIAPILAEARRMSRRKFGLFSGVEFNIDAAQELAGVCDWIITRSERQLFIEAPVLMLVQAKNEDMIKGYAQCIAEMLAAQTFNARENTNNGGDDRIYGAVTTGDKWKFLRLQNALAQIDAVDYYITDIGKIMGILLHLAAPEMNDIAPAAAQQWVTERS